MAVIEAFRIQPVSGEEDDMSPQNPRADLCSNTSYMVPGDVLHFCRLRTGGSLILWFLSRSHWDAKLPGKADLPKREWIAFTGTKSFGRLSSGLRATCVLELRRCRRILKRVHSTSLQMMANHPSKNVLVALCVFRLGL
ncbi:unnamed protein product, partial [Durusdinium trenchii]